MKDELTIMYEEQLKVLEDLIFLAQEEGRGDLYRARCERYNKVREERDYYVSLYA